jgi:hypothetical protein
MGERSDQITRKIEQTRGELGENLQELESKVKDATDWRKQFQKNPLAMIGIAFGGGVFLSRVLGGSSRSHRRYRAREDWEERRSPSADAGTKYEMKKVADTWDNIKGALIGVAASKAKDFLREAVPGFHEEYSKVEHHKGPQALREVPQPSAATEPQGV